MSRKKKHVARLLKEAEANTIASLPIDVKGKEKWLSWVNISQIILIAMILVIFASMFYVNFMVNGQPFAPCVLESLCETGRLN